MEGEPFRRAVPNTIVILLTVSSERATYRPRNTVQRREPNAPHRLDRSGTLIAPLTGAGRATMLMFKRSQMYIAFALAALAEIIVRAVTH
jgi:hypothetical protein